MQTFRPIEKIAILGRSGCGKSFLAKKILSIYPRIFIFDSLHEYSNEANAEFISNFDDFSTALLNSVNKKQFKIVIQSSIEDSNHNEELNEILRCCYYRGNATIFIDEIQNFSNVHGLSHWLRQLFLTGRHRNISIIYTTQRPGELNKTLLSQSTIIFCGNLHTNADIKSMSNYFHIEAEEIANLPDRKFFFWQSGKKLTIVNNDLT